MKPKDYYFHFTGEVRTPKKGEFYGYDDNRGIYEANSDFFPDRHTRLIYTRHEVDMPENITAIDIGGYTIPVGKTWTWIKLLNIPLIKPRPKVKKWKWVMDNGACVLTVAGLHTEDEVRKSYPNRKWYHRIDETEVEE
jgi:hypothetical protein